MAKILASWAIAARQARPVLISGVAEEHRQFFAWLQ